MLFSRNASPTAVEAETIEEKENAKVKKDFTGFAPRAATHTNYRVLWVLIGLVVALTAGFYYLFTFVFRVLELRRRNGERAKDELRTRFYEQDKKH